MEMVNYDVVKYKGDYLINMIEILKLLLKNEVDGNILSVIYAWTHNNSDVTLEFAENTYSVRKINSESWRICENVI